MNAKYQAYEEYKDSGVDWLGEVPKHWDIKKISYVAILQSGDAIISEQIKGNGNYPVYGGNGLRGYSEKFNNEGKYILIGRQGALCGNINYGYGKFWASEHAVVVHPSLPLNFKWLGETLRAMDLNQYNVSAAQPGLAVANITCLKIPFPDIHEQKQIANFLDHETAKIDTLIEKQQQLIKLLKEKRQAVISHAVTKGLNPNTPMRDSGVEWLGEVPEHWEVLKTKRFFSLECHPSPTNNNMELLSVYTDIGVRPRKELEQKGNKASTTDGYWLVKKDDLIVNKLLAWMGAIGYSSYEGVTSPAYDILRKRCNLNTKFYHYLFRTKLTQSEFKRWSRGIMEMRLRLYFEELGKIPMPFPPEVEQNEIVAEIEKLETRYDVIIEKADTQIKLLQERRTALISAAVTGKIDVRNWQPANE